MRTIEVQPENKENMIIATTASSDGKIRLFEITKLVHFSTDKIQEAIELQPIVTHDTGGARLTCLDVVGGSGGNVLTSAVEEEQDSKVDEEDQESDFDQEEVEELYNLLDLVEEAKRQGLHVEGLSDLEDSAGDDEKGDGDEDDDEDVYGDSELDGLESESGNEEEEVEEESE